MKHALMLLAAVACGAEPVRVAIVSRAAQLVPEAVARFEREHGTGLLEVRIGDGSEAAGYGEPDVAVFYFGGQEVFRRNAEWVRAMEKRGGRLLASPAENAERLTGVRVDRKGSEEMAAYWAAGGVENLTAMLSWLYRYGGGRKEIRVPPVREQAAAGLVHPRSGTPFHSLEEYLQWERRNGAAPANAPLAGVLVYQTNVKNRDMAAYDALILELERQGMRAVGVYGWPVHTLEPLLRRGEGTPFDVFLANNLGFPGAKDAELLGRLGRPVLNVMTSRVAEREWERAAQGVEAARMASAVAAPERMGTIATLMIGAAEGGGADGVTRAAPIAERVRMAAARAKRWVELRRKPNGEKRIAVLYYNNPPGKGNIGASYLNVTPSLAALTREMRRAGYETGGEIPDERRLGQMLEQTGRNIEEWAPGELEAMLGNGHVELVGMERYKQWFSELPRQFQEDVRKGWGRPEDSTLMTVKSRDGRKYFVVPGIRMGNVFVGPQPLRSTFARAADMLHNVTVPPPHSYIAAYLWYRKTFRADAIAHIGRHGTLEFLPGKNAGQAGSDAAEAILGDTPNPYVYIIDGGGESTIARRRAAGVMIGHLTPLSVKAGEQKGNTGLREAVRNYEETRETSPALAGQYREAAEEEAKRLQLDEQLGLQGKGWEERYAALTAYLEATEAEPIPAGVHTLGVLPREEVVREALEEYLRKPFDEVERRRLEGDIARWAEALVAGKDVALGIAWNAALREKAAEVVAGGREWLRNLRESPARELAGWMTVLGGRYLESGTTGDPLRTPSSIPSGRNLHDFDPALIPTKAACGLGRRLGEEMLAEYRKGHGRLPEKVSMVLWFGETIRHQGAMECEALYLMGLEPKWNSRGIVDGLRVIPEEELGRPRIDVVFTIAGIYRDGFADKIVLLDRATRLAAEQGENAIRRNTARVADRLRRSGVGEDEAKRLAAARVFGSAPGDYGAGISRMAKQSKDAESRQAVVDVYTGFMGHAYGAEMWGMRSPAALREHLAGNEAIVHSRSSALYGVLDNDDFFEFAGGLNLATKEANGGKAPEMYVNDVRREGRERVTGVQTYLAHELNARNWNPKWIGEMKRGGYAGAREMMDNLENLYGWQMTAAERMTGAFWQNSYDVYVADKHGLELEAFFEKENPHSRQMMLARLLEIDRQGVHRFAGEERERLVREYVRSVNRHGVACSANTCGNAALERYVGRQAPLVSGLGEREAGAFRRTMGAARGIAAKRAAVAAQSAGTGKPVVSGYRMSERRIREAENHPARERSRAGWALVLLAFLGAGAGREAWRMRTRSRF